MKKYFDIEIDGQVELENGKTLGELKESSISITDADVDGNGGGWPSDLPKPSEGGYGYTESVEKNIFAENQTIHLDNVGIGLMMKNEPKKTIEQIYNEGVRRVTITINNENSEGWIDYDDEDDEYTIIGVLDGERLYIGDRNDNQYDVRFGYNVEMRDTDVTIGFFYEPIIIHTVDKKYLSKATCQEAGVMRKAYFINDVEGDTVSVGDFNMLLDTLRNAGIMASSYDDQF